MSADVVAGRLARVEVGQIWRDLDPRSPGRYLVIEGLESAEGLEGDHRANCRVWKKGADTGGTVWVSIRAGKLGKGGRGFAQVERMEDD